MAIWTAKTSGTALGLVSAASKGTFVLAGIVSGTNRATTSNDGSSWSVVTTTPLRLNPIAADATMFIAYSSSGGIYSSTDGSSWSLEQSLHPISLTYTSSKFIAVFLTTPYFGHSATGLNGSWTTNAGPSDCTTRRGIWYDGTTYFVCGTDTSGFGSIWSSTNFTSWTKRHTSVNVGSVYNIAHDGTGFVATTGSQYSITSTNGTSWTENNVSGSTGTAVIGFSGVFYTITETDPSLIMRSVDHGVSWIQDLSVATNSFRALCRYGTDNVIAVGDSGIIYNGLLVASVATPTASPASGAYSGDQSVTLSCTESGASIYYTTDGSTPSAASTLYTGAITVSATTTLKAIAFKTGLDQSLILSSVYTISCAEPTASPVAGGYDNNQTVVLSTTTSGAQIRYTTNGTTPTAGSSLYSSGITISGTTTLKAITIKTGLTSSTIFSGVYTLTCGTPTASPVAGSYENNQSVTLSTTTAGASIRYTTDGSTPNGSSTLYSGALTISATTTLKAIAIKSNYTTSGVFSGTYTLGVAAPTFDPAAPGFTGPFSVTIASTTSGATIRYTLDGTTPNGSSSVYTTPIAISVETVVKAYATKSGYADSGVSTISYLEAAATPVITPSAGTFNNDQSVTITCTTPSSSIYYTTNGATPTTGSTLYTGAFTVSSDSTTVKAIAIAAGRADSSIVSELFTLVCATPTANVTAGTYDSSFSVTLSCSTTGATIKYTLDGSSPTPSHGTAYTVPVMIDGTQTIKFVAYKFNYQTSAEGSRVYTFKCATPTISLDSGTFTNSQTVTLACSTNGSEVRYTTDGSTPTVASTLYSVPFAVNSNMTLKVVGVKTSYSDSDVAEETYVFNVATPVISVAGGTYYEAQDVTLSSTTAGAAIRYTVDGTTPTGSSTLYTTAIHINSSLTLKAKAFKSGYNDSGTASEDYELLSVAPTITAISGDLIDGKYIISDNVPYILIEIAGEGSGTVRYTTNGSTPNGSSTIYTAPIHISVTTQVRAIRIDGAFSPSTVASETFILKCPTPSFGPTGGTGEGGGISTTGFTIVKSLSPNSHLTGAEFRYTLDGSTPTAFSTLYTGPIAVTTLPLTVKALFVQAGLDDSAVFSQTYTQGKINTPISNKNSGSYRHVSAIVSNPGSLSTTRYTLDGSTPTTSSAIYTTTLEISSDVTLKLRGFRTGFIDSDVATYTYTIVPSTQYLVGTDKTYLTVVDALVQVNLDNGGELLPEGPGSENEYTEGSIAGRGVREVIIDAGSYTGGIPVITGVGTYTLQFDLALQRAGADSTVDDFVIIRAASGSEHLGDPTAGVHIINDFDESTDVQIPAYTEFDDIVFEDYRLLNISSYEGIKARRCLNLTNVDPGGGALITGFYGFSECWYCVHHIEPSIIAAYPLHPVSFYNVNLTSGMLCVGCVSNNAGTGYSNTALNPLIAVDCVSVISTGYDTAGLTFGVNTTQHDCIGNDSHATSHPSVDPDDFHWEDRSIGDCRIIEAEKDDSILVTEATDPTPYIFTNVESDDIDLDNILYWELGPDWEPIRCKPVIFDHDTDTYQNTFSLVLTSATVAPFEIRYTVDGSTPTASSTLYTGPISVDGTQTIKAIAVKSGYDDSFVTQETFTFEVAELVIDTDTGTFNNAIDVMITSLTSGTAIRYTLDGTDPTELSALYTGALHLDGTCELRAIGYKLNYTTTEIASETYTFVCATPVLNPDSVGPFLDSTSVSATTATSGAVIRYTTNGDDPSLSSGLYTGPVDVLVTTNLKFRAFKSGYTQSAIDGNIYEIKCTISCDTDTGTFNDIIYVTLATGTFEGVIRYTLDGNVPTGSSDIYTVPVQIDGNTTFKARTFKVGCTSSDIVSEVYTFELIAATFDPPAGTYVGDINVLLSVVPAGTELRYTLDGSTPDGSDALYTSGIPLSVDTTIKVIAIRSGWASAYSEADYLLKCHAPVFNPPAGGYEGTQSVTITSITPGAVIFYTLDGTEPDESSTEYTTPVSVSCVKTLKAIATKSGHQSSDVTSGLYVCILPPTINDGLLGQSFSTLPVNIVLEPNLCGSDIFYTLDGSEPTTDSILYTVPFTIAQDTMIRAISWQQDQYSAEVQKGYNITVVNAAGSIRSLIRKAIKYQISQLTFSNGKSMGDVNDEQIPDDRVINYPACNIYFKPEEYGNFRDSSMTSGGLLHRGRTLVLEFLVHNINRENNETEIILSEIEDYFMTNFQITGESGDKYALDCMFLGSNLEGFHDTEPHSRLVVQLQIVYRTKLYNPYSAR